MSTATLFTRPAIAVMLGVFSCVLLVLSGLVYQHSRGQLVLLWQKMPVDRIWHEQGLAYQAALGRVWMSSHQKPSPAKVFEDGSPLGLDNALHSDIRQKGGGRFSFWYDTLYFSSSDNSDPMKNGRRYEILWPAPFGKPVVIGIYLLTLVVSALTGIGCIGTIRRRADKIAAAQATSCKINILIQTRGFYRDIFLKAACWMGLAVMAAFSYRFLHDPVVVAATLKNSLLVAVVLFVAWAAGYHFAQLRFAWKNDVAKVLAGALMFCALLLFLMLRPESNVKSPDDLAANLPWIAISLALGFVFAKLRSTGPEDHSHTQSTSSQGRLVFVIAGLIGLAVVGNAENLIKFWDLSGFGDAQGYDRDAHAIATLQTLASPSVAMPLYYYGLAVIYYIFGHFFYIQQVFNILVAAGAVTLLCLAAWNAFESKWAVLLTGLIFVYSSEPLAYTHLTQIETWYLPLIVSIYFLITAYWRDACRRHLVLLGLGLGLAINFRIQGLPLFAFLCLAPLVHRHISPKRRIVHVVVIASILGAAMLPGAIRNHFQGRGFSIKSDQAVVALLYNDPQVKFYGLNFPSLMKVYDDYITRYPDIRELDKVIKKNAFRHMLTDPVWMAKALFWRSLAAYGLLPPGAYQGLLGEGPKQTDWAKEWWGYVYWKMPVIFLLAISVVSLLVKPTRETVFFAFSIVSYWGILLVSAPMTMRQSLPLWPLHALIGVGLLFRPAIANGEEHAIRPAAVFAGDNKKHWINVCCCLLVFCVLCRFYVGRQYVFRPLKESAISIDAGIAIDNSLRSLNSYWDWMQQKQGPAPVFMDGERVRLRYMVKNYLCFSPDNNPYRRDIYFAYNNEKGFIRRTYFAGVSYFGATADRVVRENDIVEIEGTLIHADARETDYFNIPFVIQADKVKFITKYDYGSSSENDINRTENL